MKPKSKSTLHDEMLMDGTVHYGYHSDGRLFQNGKPVEPKADVVARPTPKLNVAPKPTDPPAQPKRKPPQGTGLMRAINANIEAQGGTPIVTRSKEKDEVTGLQRSINAAVAAAQRK